MIKPLLRQLQQLSPDVRLILAGLALICGFYLSLFVSVWGMLFLAVAVLLSWDALRYGSVWPAFDAFKRHQLDQMGAYLLGIRWPSLLSPRSLAYYNWLKGVLDISAGRQAAAKVHLLAAASGAIRTETDRSLIHCLLAELAIQQAEPTVAADHLRLAAALSSQAQVRGMITRLQARLDER
ncbi:MAG: hypothetical protein ACNA75_03955 [Thiohalomonadaceae bacterium]